MPAFFVFSLQFLKYPAILLFFFLSCCRRVTAELWFKLRENILCPLPNQPPVQALMVGLMSSSVFKWDVICRSWIFALSWIVSLLCHPHPSSFRKAVACWHSPTLKFKKWTCLCQHSRLHFYFSTEGVCRVKSCSPPRMCFIVPASGDHNSSLDELLHEEWKCAVRSRKKWCVSAAPLKLKNRDLFLPGPLILNWSSLPNSPSSTWGQKHKRPSERVLEEGLLCSTAILEVLVLNSEEPLAMIITQDCRGYAIRAMLSLEEPTSIWSTLACSVLESRNQHEAPSCREVRNKSCCLSWLPGWGGPSSPFSHWIHFLILWRG